LSFLQPKLNDHDATATNTFAIIPIEKKPPAVGSLGGMSETLHVTFQTLAIYAKNQVFLQGAGYYPFVKSNQLAATHENERYFIYVDVCPGAAA
jgi:hypothetical protein